MPDPIRVAIASPLEANLIERIAAAFPSDIEIRHDPDLVPAPRFTADHTGDPAWRRTPDQERRWRDLLRSAVVTLDLATLGDEGPLDLSPDLRWVQTTSAGVGRRVRTLGLDQTGVIVTTASGIHAVPLAEWTFAALLSHVKRFRHLDEEQRARRWERHCGASLAGMTLGIVGPGRIGREVARLGRAFSMRVHAVARHDAPGRAAELGVDRVFPPDRLRDMLAGCDALVLAMPHTDETDGMIGAAELATMRPGAVLVNIARGAVIDEPALVAALRSGQVGFAALDVTAVEPLPPDSPLWTLPNVLISPHSASTVSSENGLLADRFIANMAHFLADQPGDMAPRLNMSSLY
ncbi:MAG: D-2-hydroxyacid dehydrogenase [Chloroflexota bacterium]|nr:D-2-hydroxyacid dehydrogenase [Chloroflexota bacterium]